MEALRLAKTIYSGKKLPKDHKQCQLESFLSPVISLQT